MREFYLAFVVFLSCTGIIRGYTAKDSLQRKKIEEIIPVVGRKFAPDKRTALFVASVGAESPLSLNVETTEKQAVAYLKELLSRENITVSIREFLLPSDELQGRIYGVANLSVCNNRSKPEHPAELVSQTLLGTPVELLKKERGYYLVRTPDKYISWVEDDAITAMDRDAFSRWKEADKIVFTGDYGHAYEDASVKSSHVSDLVCGNILEVKGKKGKFYKVAYPDGRIAYIPVKLTQPYSRWISRPNPDASQIIGTAKTLTGVPYLWGGTSIKGVDCSGFTKTSYFLNGIILARDASQQALYGEKVDIYKGDSVSIDKCLSNLLPGDLLFFGRKKDDGTDKVIHTAIYIGKGEFIQSAGMVKVSSLLKQSPNYDAHQTKGLLSARRVLTSIGTEGISRIDQQALYQKISN